MTLIKEFHNKLLISLVDGKKLGEVLSQLARRGLRASAQSASKSGLPVFKVEPDADIIPSSRAKALLAEDAT